MKVPVIEYFALKGLELEDVFEEYFCKGGYKTYKNVSQYDFSSIKGIEKLEAIRTYVDETFHLSDDGYALDKLWLVKSFADDMTDGELPFVPHIDYKRYLKVMIYVDDVAEANGPFSAVAVNPDDYEAFRLNLKLDYKQDKKNQIDQFSLEEYGGYTGPKGTMILFDTNCPHFAGVVAKGKSRRVFRFDYELPEWKRKENSFFEIKKLISWVKPC